MSSSSSCWLGLAHRTAIVTGGASGIGRAVVETLRAAGCGVVALDRPDFDVTNRDQVDEVMMMQMMTTMTLQEQQQQQQSPTPLRPPPLFSPPPPPPATILVNCAGITRDGFVPTLTEEDWDQVINVNLKGTFNMCQSFLKYLPTVMPTTTPDTDTAGVDSTSLLFDDDNNTSRPSSSSPPVVVVRGTTTASIINVGSIVSERGNLGQVNYAASKGGVVGLTRALAKEVAHRHVRVNAVLPGFIATPMTATVPAHVLTMIQSQRIALRRLGRPEDVANLVAFLASDRSGYITGTTIECSGMIAL